MRTVEERFYSRVGPPEFLADPPGKAEGPCLPWTAGRNTAGYGYFRLGGKTQGVHRVAWRWANGTIPDGLHVLHKCDIPPCVNPLHLWLGTDEDNKRDKAAKGRARGATGDANGSRTHPEKVVRGEAHGLTELNEAKVLEIRALYPAGGISHAALGRQFNVSAATIWNIIHRKTWTHI